MWCGGGEGEEMPDYYRHEWSGPVLAAVTKTLATCSVINRQERKARSYFWQKSCPQFLQWWRLSVRENRTEQLEQLSPPSSFTQWSAAERPGWSLTDQLNTRPLLSPTRILLWSLQKTCALRYLLVSLMADKELVSSGRDPQVKTKHLA